MIKSNLVTIAYEVEESYNNYYMKWNEFLEEVNDILSYYKSKIYLSGKTIINKKIGNTNKINLDDIDNEFIDSINYNAFIEKLKDGIYNCCNDYSKEELYDQIISIIIGECIILYKQSQIVECKNLNIKSFKLIADHNCCELCKIQSRFELDTNNYSMDNIHPYCKQVILPLDISKTTNLTLQIADFVNVPSIFVPIIKNIITKLKIHLKDYISYKKFTFGEFNSIIINDNEILIPYELTTSINIEEIITEQLIRDKLLEGININDWKENFNIKKDSKVLGDNCRVYTLPFVNNIATINCEEYIVQSSVNYILNGQYLKDIDINAYNKLKELFTKEFVKG